MQQSLIIYSCNDFYKIKIDSDVNQKKILSIYLELQSSLLAPLVRDSKARFESSSELESFASIVIQIAFSDYETAVAVSQKFGQDEEEHYRVCRRNRDRCICTYFHCRCDKISWREPISIYRKKKEREREKKWISIIAPSNEDSPFSVEFPRIESNRTFVSDLSLVSRYRCCDDCGGWKWWVIEPRYI